MSRTSAAMVITAVTLAAACLLDRCMSFLLVEELGLGRLQCSIKSGPAQGKEGCAAGSADEFTTRAGKAVEHDLQPPLGPVRAPQFGEERLPVGLALRAGGARVGAGVGTGTVLYDPNQAPGQ